MNAPGALSTRRLIRGAAVLAIMLLPVRSWASESEWPQSLYLPGITVSAPVGAENAAPTDIHKRELGRCDILLWITADGYIRVAQVIKSSGHARLDEASLRAVTRKKIVPARDKSGPIDRWAILPVTFEALMAKDSKPPDHLAPSAALAPNQSLHVKPSDYPQGALERREHGDVWVHVNVSDSGQVIDLIIAQSSCSSDLDEAAFAAIGSAHFSPAFRDHKPVKSSADVVVSWMLPELKQAGTSSSNINQMVLLGIAL